MRLLIAGWQGQIARAIAETAPGRRDISACALGRPALDICEVRTIERALSDDRPDVIINTAGYTAVDEAEADQQRAFAFNRDGARLLAKVAASRGVPIVHLSTAYVFDGAKSGLYLETDATTPLNTYGHSKLEGERAVRDANPRHVILRTSWIFSPYPKNFATTIFTKAKAREPLRVVVDQTGNPTYALDLAHAIFDVASRAHAATLARDNTIWGTYHVANAGAPASWRDLAAEICRAAGLGTAAQAIIPISTGDYNARGARPLNASLDTRRISERLAIEMRDWHEAAADCSARLNRSS